MQDTPDITGEGYEYDLYDCIRVIFYSCTVKEYNTGLQQWCDWRGYKQARNQFGTPRGAKSFLRGVLIFYTMSNRFELCPKHFSRGAKNFLGGFAPLVTGLGTRVQPPPWKVNAKTEFPFCLYSGIQYFLGFQ